jgi:hypothetical protein
MDVAEEINVESLTSVAQMVTNVVPYGKALDWLISGVGFVTSMGTTELVDPNNVCSTQRGAYINARPEGKNCIADFNFNSEPVSRFLKQSKDRQKSALSCGDTCRYYKELIIQLSRTNSFIERNSLPIFQKTPECLSGGRVKFSFEAIDSSHIQSPMSAPMGAISPSWRGLIDTPTGNGTTTERLYYKEVNATVSQRFLVWNVEGDLISRNKVSANVSPDYTLGQNNVSMTFPGSFRNSGGTALKSPSLLFGHRSARASQPLHEMQDPALQAMGVGAALVSGCCAAPQPARGQCLSRFPVVDQWKKRSAEPADPLSSEANK